jgi:hypothetical protein
MRTVVALEPAAARVQQSAQALSFAAREWVRFLSEQPCSALVPVQLVLVRVP